MDVLPRSLVSHCSDSSRASWQVVAAAVSSSCFSHSQAKSPDLQPASSAAFSIQDSAHLGIWALSSSGL